MHFKKLTFLLTIFVVLFHSNYAQSIKKLNNQAIISADLDKKINYLMKEAQVHGMAITVFNNKEPVYKKTFGYKRASTKEPIKTGTNIYGASLSKAVFAVLVMKLVEDGVINLDKPLQEYLEKPIFEYKPLTKWHDNYSDLKNDSLYRKITARMCLDHTSGFPNWRWFEPDQKLRVKFEPGSRYSYSGEGLVYLQVVLEKMLGKTLEELMQAYIFKPLGMKMSSYTWQPGFEQDYCVGHNAKGELYEKDKDNEARSASTLETTLDDYTAFTGAVLKNTILKPETTTKMFSTQIRIRSIQQFTELSLRDSTANDGIELGYGLGWGLLKSPYGIAAFKEGHGDGFQHYSILFPEKGTGIIIMTNSDNGESIFKELLEYSIGDTYTPWYWQNYIPYNYKKGSVMRY
jgi:serine-type D-Ala-D-Ala carboxypeptidase/endopeptidase